MTASRLHAVRCLVAIVLGIAIGTAASATPAPGEHIVLDYSLTHGKLALEDRVTTIRVLDDGTVFIHRPYWQIDAGDFTTRLTADELGDLIERTRVGIAGFDNEAVEAACHQADSERLARDGIEVTTSDDTWTRIRLSAVTGNVPSSLVEHEVTWRNLAWSAETYPAIAPLQNLQTAERIVRSLLERDDLVAVAAPATDAGATAEEDAR